MPQADDGMPPATSPPPLSYPAMRLRWCGLALRAFLRRWGVYVLVSAGVLSAGAAGWEQIIMAAAAWLVLPLFLAAAHGAWLLLALPLQALAGAVCVWGARSLLWPPRWGEAERALPIPRELSLRSDTAVVLIALTPWLLLQAVGAAAVLGHRPAWLQPVHAWALGALLLAALMSVALGVAYLQSLRRLPRGRAQPRALAERSSLDEGPQFRRRTALGWLPALFLLPLWRGPARRTAWALLAGGAAMALPAIGLLVLRAGEPWWLAAASLLALLVATRVNHLSRLDFAELLQASTSLPLLPLRLQRVRASIGLWPLLPGLALLIAAALRVATPTLRLPVLVVWEGVCIGSCTFEVCAAPAKAADKAGRWLFSLILCICLATEVLA